MTPDPYAEMAPLDAARARQADADALEVQRKREQAAKALLAPPGPAQAVRRAWAPVSGKITPGPAPAQDPVVPVALAWGTPDVAMPDAEPGTVYLDLNTYTLYQAQEGTP